MLLHSSPLGSSSSLMHGFVHLHLLPLVQFYSFSSPSSYIVSFVCISFLLCRYISFFSHANFFLLSLLVLAFPPYIIVCVSSPSSSKYGITSSEDHGPMTWIASRGKARFMWRQWKLCQIMMRAMEVALEIWSLWIFLSENLEA